MTPTFIDRVAGTVLGGACGDALGAGYEFQDRPPPDIDMIGGGPFGFGPGEWTDDTQMLICVLEEAATGAIDPTAVAGRFLNWYHGHPKDVGNQTAAVLGSSRQPEEVAKQSKLYFERHPRGAAGNGSLMRTAPVALANLGDDEALVESARTISDLTHGDPLAGDACVIWCISIDRAIGEGRLDGVWDGLDHLAPEARDRWSGWLKEAEAGPPGRFKPNGFVVPALQAAHAAIHHTPVPDDQSPAHHLTHALVAAVRIGHDTDTVAAIAGALLGARWGASAVPLRWRAMLHGWPGYRAGDLIGRAVLAGRKGQTDDTGWPSARRLSGWYAEHYPAAAAAVALPDDPGVILGNVAGLALPEAARADVVLSLCRIGRDDLPAATADQRIAEQLMLIDTPGANPNLDFILSDTAQAISRWRAEGRTVFVHCVRSESRTPAIAAAYVAHRDKIPATEALRRIRAVLPRATPNDEFAGALTRLWP